MRPLCFIALLGACTGESPDPASNHGTPPTDSGEDGGNGGEGGEAEEPTGEQDLRVVVTLDGEPAPGVEIRQPGTDRVWFTAEDGSVLTRVDRGIDGEVALSASHPEARIGVLDLEYGDWPELGEIALERFDTSDNPAYVFQHPGDEDENETTAYCAHCHITINEDWRGSAHAQSARNTKVQDLYAGAAAAYATEAACLSAGGRWRRGTGPGTGEPAFRCYIGDGALPALNPGCDETEPCDSAPGSLADSGSCADCHAPGIDGRLGGRDLLEATGIAYEHGVHCDVCHKVESVDLESDSPGISGRLRIVRPSEDEGFAGLDWTPLTFGPYTDVINPRMGSVAREHFQDSTLCAGCHEYDTAPMVPGTRLDPERWPEGRLPVQSTWSELAAGPLGPDIACVSCHMPPDPTVGNSADLGNEIDAVEQGVAAGWLRPPGAVRRHAWFGPRHEEERMIDLAAALFIDASVEDGLLVARVTTRNAGPAHAIPTGEPLRSLVLLVEARCEGTALLPVGGATVPDHGGFLDRQGAGDDWSRWPGAQPGERIRVIRQTGAFYDYTGHGPFGDGRFSAEEKGLPVEEIVAESQIVSVDGDRVTLDAPLPEGDLAYRVPATSGLPEDGDASVALAGAPGFAFARVMADASGRRMVPHFLAVDVVSDNRILPASEYTTEHRFQSTCADPVVEAVLLHRPFPLDLARERGWAQEDAVMARTKVVLP